MEKNEGSRNVGGHWVKIYVSSDNVKDSSDKIIGQKYVSYLQKGSSQILAIKIAIPSNYSAGPAFLLAITDSENVIGESNESNNINQKPTTIR